MTTFNTDWNSAFEDCQNNRLGTGSAWARVQNAPGYTLKKEAGNQAKDSYSRRIEPARLVPAFSQLPNTTAFQIRVVSNGKIFDIPLQNYAEFQNFAERSFSKGVVQSGVLVRTSDSLFFPLARMVYVQHIEDTIEAGGNLSCAIHAITYGWIILLAVIDLLCLILIRSWTWLLPKNQDPDRLRQDLERKTGCTLSDRVEIHFLETQILHKSQERTIFATVQQGYHYHFTPCTRYLGSEDWYLHKTLSHMIKPRSRPVPRPKPAAYTPPQQPEPSKPAEKTPREKALEHFGLKEGCSNEEISRIYKQKTKQVYPDRLPKVICPKTKTLILNEEPYKNLLAHYHVLVPPAKQATQQI